MKCSSVRKNLSAFLDNELSNGKRGQIEAHISECVDCHRELGKLRGMIGLISNTEHPDTPAQLWEGTRRKLEAASDQDADSQNAYMGSYPRWGGYIRDITLFCKQPAIFHQI